MSNLFTEKNETAEALKAAKARVDAEARENYRDKAWRYERAQEISENIYEGFESENLIDLLTETERLDLDGRSTISEVRGLEVFHTARNGYIEESYIRKDVMEIEQDFMGFHVVESEDRLRTSFSETAETLVNLGGRRVQTEANNRVLSTFQTAIPSSHASYTAVSGLTLAALNSALSAVKDASMSEDVTIIGRRAMTDQIVDEITQDNAYTAYVPETNEDLLRRGKVGTYRGANVVELRNYLDADGNSFFPANELYVVGRNAAKTAFFGGPQVKEFLEDDNWFWHYIYKVSMGVVVYRSDRVRRLVDSTVTP